MKNRGIMKINIKEGIYRIFLILALSFGGFSFLSLYSHGDSLLLAAVCGVTAIIAVYISYFVLYWIISGFIELDDNINGLKGLVIRFFKNYKSFNFILFLFSLSICIFLAILLTMNVEENKNIEKKLKECNSSLYQYEQMWNKY